MCPSDPFPRPAEPVALGPQRPRRADARRNYDAILVAARAAFAQGGAQTSLEEIARAAGVGIGTLYRHFPTRQALLEAAYLDEVQAVCASAQEFAGGDPWLGLVGWLRRFAGFLSAKRALLPELVVHLDPDGDFFAATRSAIHAAAGPLVTRAQAAGVVRADTDLPEIIQLLAAVARIAPGRTASPDHLLELALDGLRYRPSSPAG